MADLNHERLLSSNGQEGGHSKIELILELEQAVSLEMRRQISLHCMLMTSQFKKNCEYISMTKANIKAAQQMNDQDQELKA